MVFKIFYVLCIFSIVRFNSGSKCEKDNCVAVPVIDHLAAPLTAQLDISELNKQIGEIIKDKVKQEVENVVTKLVDTIADNRFRSAEKKLTSKMYNMVVLNVRDLNDSFEQHSAELEDKVASVGQSLRAEIRQKPTQVTVTSCLTSGGPYSNTLVKFSDVKTYTGISNINLFISSGEFTCEHAGVYLVSVTIVINSGTNGYVYIMKNDTDLQISGRRCPRGQSRYNGINFSHA